MCSVRLWDDFFEDDCLYYSVKCEEIECWIFCWMWCCFFGFIKVDVLRLGVSGVGRLFMVSV